MTEKGRRSDITNLSLQDEEKLSYATYFEALEAVSKTPQVMRTSSACSSFETHEDLSLVYALQKRNFKFQATGSPHLAGIFPIFQKYGTDKKSVQFIHSIGHDRSGQNKSMRDEELIKAEHFSIVK